MSTNEIDESAISDAASLLANAKSVGVLTGAGISTDSGIPDFRGPQGVWTLNPKAEKTSTLSHYLNDPEVREIAWQTRIHSPAWDAVPNAGHAALVNLERRGRLLALVTQNIDELHQRAGTSADKVVEVHGTWRRAQCWSCKREWPMETFLVRVRAGEVDPRCLECGGVVKSATISFGQNLVPHVIERALTTASECDLLLCVGTTLAVGPVNRMVPIAAARSVPIVIVNGSPTDMDNHATVLVRGAISDVLPAIIG